MNDPATPPDDPIPACWFPRVAFLPLRPAATTARTTSNEPEKQEPSPVDKDASARK